jgi:hypothetical protein
MVKIQNCHSSGIFFNTLYHPHIKGVSDSGAVGKNAENPCGKTTHKNPPDRTGKRHHI